MEHRNGPFGVPVAALPGMPAPAPVDQTSLSALLNAVQAINRIATNIAQVFPSISTTQTTVGAAGSASALPGDPEGWLNLRLADGTKVVVPYWLAE